MHCSERFVNSFIDNKMTKETEKSEDIRKRRIFPGNNFIDSTTAKKTFSLNLHRIIIPYINLASFWKIYF